MKFVVKQGYSNEVDVKLHWETKDKIKRIAYWAFLGACGAVGGLHIATKKKDNQDEE